MIILGAGKNLKKASFTREGDITLKMPVSNISVFPDTYNNTFSRIASYFGNIFKSDTDKKIIFNKDNPFGETSFYPPKLKLKGKT